MHYKESQDGIDGRKKESLNFANFSGRIFCSTEFL